ncbi:MAG: hypothetical protein QNJ74_15655 [Trichodesmium sp. MO_231.B1]|nr:hypothetical protein [Trichodesmium sp. MO_231.B1]
MMKQTPQYKVLPAKVAQQVLRGLEKNCKSFLRGLSEFKENPDRFLGKLKIPGNRETKKEQNLLVYRIQVISKVSLKKGLVKLSKTVIKFPTHVADSIAEVRIVPKCDCYVIEIIYKTTKQLLNPNEMIGAIDLGVDNLMALT